MSEKASTELVQSGLNQRRSTPASWLRRYVFSGQEVGVLIILLALVAYLSLKTDTFLKPQNIRNVTLSFSWIAIAAFGQTLVIITSGIDLSTRSVMALSGLAAGFFISGTKAPWAEEQVTETGRVIQAVSGQHWVIIAILGGCTMGLFLGALNGILIAWGGLPPFIATLGTMSLARGICYGWAEGWPFRQLHPDFKILGQNELPFIGDYVLPYPTIVMVVLAVIMTVYLLRTIWGYRIYALGGNEQAAQLSGINTRNVKLMAYSIAGLLAGVGGTLMTARLNVAAPDAAQGYELDVIAAVFIGGASVKGGKGTILGTLIGAAIMQVLRSGLNLLGFSAYWQPAAIGLVIILAVMFDQARQNAQVQAYFRQFEGRVAMISVVSVAVVFSLVASVFKGLDGFLVGLFVLIPYFSLAYYLHNKMDDEDASPFLLYGFGLLTGIIGAVILVFVWSAIRQIVAAFLKPERQVEQGSMPAI